MIDRILDLSAKHRALVLLFSVALFAGALYFQYIERQDPCPLCIIQRYCLLLIAIFSLLGARMSGWRGVRVFEALAALSALGGIVAAAKLVYVQANPGFSCGFDRLQPVVDALPPAHWLPGVFKVHEPHADAPVGRDAGDVFAAEPDPARGRLLCAGDGPQQRGLAGAVGAHQRHHLAPAEGEADVAHGVQQAVVEVEMFDGERAHAGTPPR